MNPADTWDLTPLFASVAEWEAAYTQASDRLSRYETFRGRLGEGPAVLRSFFEFDAELSRLLDRLANYATLRCTEDQSDAAAQALRARYVHLATKASELSAFFRPELLSLPEATLQTYLASPELAEWKVVIERVARYRPHTLSDREEKLLAMQGQMAEAANLVFTQLNNADLKFGTLKDEKGREVELSHASFSSFLNSPKREVRAKAFHQYYAQFDAHKNTIAAALASSVHRDVYYAKVRGFGSAREAALFPDNVPVAVYDNLIASVRKALPSVYRYLEVRRRAMKLKALHHYDTYVPILADLKKHHTWEQAVDVVCASLAPLGSEYVETLRRGLTSDRWCDRYPNRGKQSGAFSSGCYDSPPYILMNFRPDVLEHVFTLTHEAGHSMHTWYSVRNQPYQYHDYVIFVAEVASTFNEQLLARHLMSLAKDDRERAYLINRQIDGIRATIIRQTMFAEFERDIHALAEAGEPLTLQAMRQTYRKLLDAYFGPQFVVDDVLELECLRIPHFYRAFYVYKYATGLAAAIALSQKVLSGEAGALDRYLGFLKGGGSRFPLELLKDAGVDMTTPEPVDAALSHFDALVTELDALL
ncbi:MAG: oligoendopeptidase F [Tepidisphaerales bacterium]